MLPFCHRSSATLAIHVVMHVDEVLVWDCVEVVRRKGFLLLPMRGALLLAYSGFPSIFWVFNTVNARST